MTNKVYKMFLGKIAEAWYQLSSEEQSRLMDRVEAALAEVGGKTVIMCDPSWANEQWDFWGVEEFPNLEAVQKHTELLNELDWFRYSEAISVLGTDRHPPEAS